MIPSSELNKKIKVYKEFETTNYLGSQVPTTFELFSTWSKVYVKNGGVQYDETLDYNYIEADFTIRYRTNIGNDCKIHYENNIYDISLIEEIDGDLKITAKANLSDSTFTADVSLVTEHNALSGIQGGSPGQYYHLTLDEYSNLSSDSASQLYVDGSLALRDASILQLFENGTGGIEQEFLDRTIYVETTGDDETGDGKSVETAFATFDRVAEDIANYVVNCTITIQFGIGTFYVDADTAAAFKHITVVGTGRIHIKGTWVDELTGISLSATSDPFVHNVNGATFSANAHTGHYAYRNDSIIVPIATHEANQIQTTYYSPSISKILSLGTKFNVTSVTNGNELSIAITALKDDSYRDETAVSYYAIDIQLSSFFYVNPFYPISFKCCNFIQNGSAYVISPSSGHFNTCYFYGNRHIMYYLQSAGGYVNIEGCIVHGTSGYNGIFLYGTSIKKLGKIIFTGLQYAFDYYDDYSYVSLDSDIKLDNVTGLCKMTFGDMIQTPGSTLYVDNVDHLLNISSNRNVKFSIQSVTGDLTTGPISSASSIGKCMFNPDKQLFISVPNIYPNYEVDLSTTLINNATTEITIGNITQNRSITIDYTIERNTLFEEGQLRILNDDSSLFLNQLNIQDNNSNSGIGVSFEVDFNTLDSNLIDLKVILNDYDAGTIKYSARRQMK